MQTSLFLNLKKLLFGLFFLATAVLLSLNIKAIAQSNDSGCDVSLAQMSEPVLDPPHALPFDKINYELHGPEDGEVLVLIHGLDSALQTWHNVVPHFSTHYRVLVYDQRGHGRSGENGNNYSSEVMAHDLKVLMDHLGIKDANILGHSVGARTAAEFALKYSSHTKSLIIEDMDLGKLRTDVGDYLKRAEEAKKEIPLNYATKEEAREKLEAFYGADTTSYILNNKLHAENDGTFSLMFRPWASILYDGQSSHEDFTPYLEKFKMPVLILKADSKEGSALPHSHIAVLKHHIPHLELIEFPGASHSIHWSQPEAFVKAVQHFLNKNRDGG